MVPIEVVAGLFFVLIALVFVGLGQVMGRCFNAIPNRVVAYTTNVLGSLAGIAIFGAGVVSCDAALGLVRDLRRDRLCFLPRRTFFQLFCIIVAIAVPALFAFWRLEFPRVIDDLVALLQGQLSPSVRHLLTNNIGHQTMMQHRRRRRYMLPHLLNRDSGGQPFEDVLIIGAGSGNDVAARAGQQARHVDAVEIDPVLNEIGRADHPDHPYRRPRVTIHLDDGRSFVRTTEPAYDLIDLRARRLAGAPLRLFEPAARELPVHRAGLPRHQGAAQARRRVRHVQLLPPGLGRRAAGENGREGLRCPSRS